MFPRNWSSIWLFLYVWFTSSMVQWTQFSRQSLLSLFYISMAFWISFSLFPVVRSSRLNLRLRSRRLKHIHYIKLNFQNFFYLSTVKNNQQQLPFIKNNKQKCTKKYLQMLIFPITFERLQNYKVISYFGKLMLK